MKEIKTILPFDWYKRIASSTLGWIGDKDFLELFVPAVRKLSDNDIDRFIAESALRYSNAVTRVYNFVPTPGYKAINQVLHATDIVIVRTYVERRLFTIKKEEELAAKREELRFQFREQVHKESWFLKFKDNPQIHRAEELAIDLNLAHYEMDDSKVRTLGILLSMELDSLQADLDAQESLKLERERLIKFNIDKFANKQNYQW